MVRRAILTTTMTAVAAAVLAVPVAAAPASTSTTGEAPGGPGPDDWTVETIAVEASTGPDDDLSVTIDADLWVPSSASPQTPAPAVLTTHGFGGTKDGDEQLANAAYFASHGYVVLSYTSQGFGGSSSCIGLDSLDYDVKNARALLDHLAALDYVALDGPGDPKVGLVGGSYGGGAQGLIGAVDDRVDALAIGRSWHTLQYSLNPNNWIPTGSDPWDLDATDQGVFKQGWTSLFFALGSSQPAQGNGGCDPVTQQTEFPGQPPCPGFIPAICPTFTRLSTTGDATQADRDLIGRSSLATVIDDLDTPTLLLQGQPDTLFTPNESIATYLHLRERGVPTAMIWHSGGHGGYVTSHGEAEAYGGPWDDTPDAQAEFATGYLPRRTLQWFERHVRDRDVDTGPTFAWHRDWVDVDLEATGGTAAPAFGGAAAYPVPTLAPRTYVLDPAEAALVPDGGEVTGGQATFLNPAGGEPAAYSETPNFTGPRSSPSLGDVPPQEQPGQFAEFVTPTFDDATEVVGVPTLRLHLSHVAPTDLRFFAKLYDIAPDGSETLIRRMVAPARIPDDALAAGAVDVRMVGIAWRFEEGHALRLVLSATDQSYSNQRSADQITVASTAADPSTLTLPVLPAGVSDPGPAPAPDPAPAPEPDPAPAPSLPATGGGAAAVGLLALVGAAAGRTRRR